MLGGGGAGASAASLRRIRQQIAASLGIGFSSLCSGAGSATTLVDTLLGRFPDDRFVNKSEVMFTGPQSATSGAANDGRVRHVSAFAPGTGTLTVRATPTAITAPAASDSYDLLENSVSFFDLDTWILEGVQRVHSLVHIPYLDESLSLVAGTYVYNLPQYEELDLGNLDAVATRTFTDSGMTQANDYWNGALCMGVTGQSRGVSCTVTDFVASTDTATVAIAHGYGTTSDVRLVKFPFSSIRRLLYLDDTGKWVAIPDSAWEIMPGAIPQIRFPHTADASINEWRRSVWAPVSKQLRIEGTRPAILPWHRQLYEDPGDYVPVEVNTEFIRRHCMYVYHSSRAENPQSDPQAHLQQVEMMRQHADSMLSEVSLPPPPGSRLVSGWTLPGPATSGGGSLILG